MVDDLKCLTWAQLDLQIFFYDQSLFFQDNDTYPKECVVVQWDSGEKNVYRVGYEKAYDLRLYDNATIGRFP